MICPKGGYVNFRHNQVRDIVVKLLSEVCHDVATEPPLLPLTGEQFPLRTTNKANDARYMREEYGEKWTKYYSM